MNRNKFILPVKTEPPPEPEKAPSGIKKIWQQLKSGYKRFSFLFLIVAFIAVAALSITIYDITRPAPNTITQNDIDKAVEQTISSLPPAPSYAAEAYSIIAPSVVRINALIKIEGEEPFEALGTGVIINDMGMVLTSRHIIRDASDMQIVFQDGSWTDAMLVLEDASKDMAVLRPRVIPDDLIPAVLGTSSRVRVGDEVVAVGNPFGINFSASAGIISGLGRVFRSPETGVLTNLIQFDAAANPGNSGGPLVNRNGEVLGIIAALLNPIKEEFFVGIGFAVPIDVAAGALTSPVY